MKRTVQCEYCRGELELSVDLLEIMEFHEFGQGMEATILKCPICENDSVVQIDNEETNEMAAFCVKTKRNNEDRAKHGKAPIQKQTAKAAKYERKLKEIRKDLMKKHGGLVDQLIESREEKQAEAIEQTN